MKDFASVSVDFYGMGLDTEYSKARNNSTEMSHSTSTESFPAS